MTAQRTWRRWRQQGLDPRPRPVRHTPAVVALDKPHENLLVRGRHASHQRIPVPTGVDPKPCVQRLADLSIIVLDGLGIRKLIDPERLDFLGSYALWRELMSTYLAVHGAGDGTASD